MGGAVVAERQVFAADFGDDVSAACCDKSGIYRCHRAGARGRIDRRLSGMQCVFNLADEPTVGVTERGRSHCDLYQAKMALLVCRKNRRTVSLLGRRRTVG
jgi:hypothetical protein